MKIKTLVLCVLSVFFTRTLHAQAPIIAWQTCLGGSREEHAFGIQATRDGGYILIGQASSHDGDVPKLYAGDADPGDCWVVKLNSAGAIEWSKTLGGSFDDGGKAICQTPDGGYIGLGGTNSLDGDAAGTHGGGDCLLFKLSSTGNVLWKKCLGGEKADGISSMVPTPDGGYILAGGTQSTGGDVSGNHGLSDAWIVKIDGGGNILWQKCIGGTGYDNATSIRPTPDGGYILVGASSSDDGDIPPGTRVPGKDIWVVKLAADASIQWQRFLGGSQAEGASDIFPMPDGGYTLLASTNSNDGDISGNHDVTAPGLTYDVWIAKLNSSGGTVWQRCYGGSQSEIANAGIVTPDGGLLVAGTATSADGDVTCMNDPSYGSLWVFKIDGTGVLQWDKTMGGNRYDDAFAISLTSEGGAVVTGYTSSSNLPRYHPASGVNLEDIYVVRLDATAIAGPVAVSIDPPPASLCTGSSVTLKANISNLFPVGYIQWIRNGVTYDINTPTFTAADYTSGEQISCRVYDLSDDCNPVQSFLSNKVTMSISPLPKPSVTISADATSICAGGSSRFTAAVTNGNTSPQYQWMVDGQPAGSNAPTYNPATLADGDIVSCIYSDNGCASANPNSSNSIRITVAPNTSPGISITAAATQLCSGTPASFTAIPVNGGPAPTYQWLVNGSPAGIPSTNPTYFNSILNNGDVVSCMIRSNATCTSPATASSNQVSMTVYPTGAATLKVDRTADPICEGSPVVFKAVSSNAGTSPIYQWQVDGKPAGDGGDTYTSTTLVSGDIVSCTVTDNQGCTTPATVILNPGIYPNPVIGKRAPLVISKGQAQTLVLPVTGEVATFSWTPSTGLSDPNVATPLFDAMKSTDFTLNVVSPQGCSASGSLSVKVVSRLAVPGAFSPNGDGLNDVFYVIGGPVGSVIKDLMVFDRWGSCVFQVHGAPPDSPAYGWDGRIAGQPAPAGAYVYELRMVFADGTQQQLKGTVVLVR